MSRQAQAIPDPIGSGPSSPPLQVGTAPAGPSTLRLSLWSLALAIGLGASPAWGCAVDADCDDGLWCNGTETCVEPTCVAGTAPPCGACCNEVADLCCCTTDSQCDDGLFCNGTERCDPTDPAADSLGCLPASSPACGDCSCIEVEARCDCGCAVPEDADGDGSIAIACGGDDCEPDDPNTYPGNPETCDAGHDEDCNPATLGGTDDDGDGFESDACCNLWEGTLFCGDDCNDAQPAVNPHGAEVCNGVDDNCDGSADEGLTQLFYADLDGDGWGASTGSSVAACTASPGWSSLLDDCNDLVPGIHPGAVELCNNHDDDCDGLIDEGFPPVSCP